MDVANHDNTTTAFITLDAFDGQKALKVIAALEKCHDDDYTGWNALISDDDELRTRLCQQGLENPQDRKSVKWDDATLLFVSCIKTDKSGQNYSLGDGRIRDRFGRFPWGDGSSLNYLLEFIRPPLTNSAIIERISIEVIVGLLGDEPLDGGVRDIVKHLSTILKAAERNGVGIVMRSHL